MIDTTCRVEAAHSTHPIKSPMSRLPPSLTFPLSPNHHHQQQQQQRQTMSSPTNTNNHKHQHHHHHHHHQPQPPPLAGPSRSRPTGRRCGGSPRPCGPTPRTPTSAGAPSSGRWVGIMQPFAHDYCYCTCFFFCLCGWVLCSHSLMIIVIVHVFFCLSFDAVHVFFLGGGDAAACIHSFARSWLLYMWCVLVVEVGRQLQQLSSIHSLIHGYLYIYMRTGRWRSS